MTTTPTTPAHAPGAPAHASPTATNNSPLNASTVAPLWAVCAFTILNSVGTGVVNNGIYFLAKNAYAFDRLENYALGVVIGITYIAGALGVGPALERLCHRVPWLTHRLVLAALMVALALMGLLPWLAAGLRDTPDAGGAWSIWVVAALFGPLTGALWPITESYVTAGRTGDGLRRAIGIWNISWSATVAASLWLIGPLVAPAPRLVLAALAPISLLALACLPPMGRDPGRHLDDEPHEVPTSYEALLAVFRILLPMSYFVISALGPNLPTAFQRLGVAPAWHTPLAATWTLIRVPAFLILAHWHAWHGRWWTPITGLILVAVGFALAVLPPALLDQSAPLVGTILLEVGLTLLGLGMAIIYVGALYYVSAARHGAVSAGGSHEALIGVGYVGGPACGLLVAGAIHAGLLPDPAFEPVVLTLVGAAILTAAVLAWRSARRAHR